MRWRSGLLNVALAIASALGTLLACEALAAVWVKTHPYLGTTPERLLRSDPPPYRHSPYFSKRFVEEEEFRNTSFYMRPGSPLILIRDAQGPFINNVGGHRVTTDAPETSEHRVFVFGGSTIYSGEVPDPFTIPSYLQRQLNAALPGRYRVVNCGVSSVNVSQQLAWLQLVTLAPGDVVVFYDGINDLTQGVFYRSPRGTLGTTQQVAYAELNLIQRLALKAAATPYLRRSYLLDYAFLPFAYGNKPLHIEDVAQREALFQHSADVYGDGLRAAHALAAERGARFVHFLQPNLFTGPLRTSYERQLAANVRVVFAGYSTVFGEGQAYLRRAADALRQEGIASVDLSRSFTPLPPDEDVFLDAMHVTEVANRLIAAEILRQLVPEAPAAPAPTGAALAAFHQDDRETWERFAAVQPFARVRPEGPSLVANGDFAAGLEPWALAQRADLEERRYPRVNLHNFLWGEIQPVADLMQVELTSRCEAGRVLRVYLNWTDATGFGDVAVDRLAFDCTGARATASANVKRPAAAVRAGLVIDTPGDDETAVVYRVDVRALGPDVAH